MLNLLDSNLVYSKHTHFGFRCKQKYGFLFQWKLKIEISKNAFLWSIEKKFPNNFWVFWNDWIRWLSFECCCFRSRFFHHFFVNIKKNWSYQWGVLPFMRCFAFASINSIDTSNEIESRTFLYTFIRASQVIWLGKLYN